MIFIAHRGLTEGPDKNLENNPETINYALSEGFEAEIDVWRKENKWFLGHDYPIYEISESFLTNKKLWIHCKNIDALQYLNRVNYSINYFWHDNDDYTLTSYGYIWVYPGKLVTPKSICVMPERIMDINFIHKIDCFGVCSDHVSIIRKNSIYEKNI